ncbi:DNA glycosylase [Mycena amicta]|nr:DNA glycosylase [Mycena amicta]
MGKRKYEESDDDSDYASKRGSRKKRTRSPTPPSASLHAKSTHIINKTDIDSIRTALLEWYATVHESRNMPWRKPFNPSLGPEDRAQRAYEVWVSEIMLQQTQVATVIPYYNRWMNKFPTIHELARASIDEVNALWKGLGYYSRASRLLAGANKAVSDFDGKLPDNSKDLQAHIPGIGRYSGAISSIAYGENAPVLDGNVTRLLSRLLALHAPPKGKPTLDVLWNAATAMVEGLSATQYPGDVNQALIELGSTVCKVRDPNCDGCPLRSWCTANGGAAPTPSPDIEDLCTLCVPLPDGADVTSYPMRADKKKAREELDVVCVVEWRQRSDRRFLLVRRPEGGLLAGLDEFPTSEIVSATLSAVKQAQIPHKIIPSFLKGAKIKKVEAMGDVLHVFSHIKKTYRVQWVLLQSTPEPPQSVKGKSSIWVAFDDVVDKNIGTGVVKIWNLCKSKWEVED